MQGFKSTHLIRTYNKRKGGEPAEAVDFVDKRKYMNQQNTLSMTENIKMKFDFDWIKKTCEI